MWPVCTFVQPQPFNAAEGFSPQAESTESCGPCWGVVCKWSGLEDLPCLAGYAVSVISNDGRDLWWNRVFFPFLCIVSSQEQGPSRNLGTWQAIIFYSSKFFSQPLKMAKIKGRIYTRCMTTADCIYKWWNTEEDTSLILAVYSLNFVSLLVPFNHACTMIFPHMLKPLQENR